MNSTKKKALIAANNQGDTSNDFQHQYRTNWLFFATLKISFFTKFRQAAVWSRGASHAI